MILNIIKVNNKSKYYFSLKLSFKIGVKFARNLKNSDLCRQKSLNKQDFDEPRHRAHIS